MMLALRIIGITTLAFIATAFCCGCFLIAVMAIKATIGIWRDERSMEGVRE